MSKIVTTEYFDEQVITDLLTHSTTTFDGVLKICDMGLFVNDAVPAKDSLLTDFTEPTYTGYARQVQTFVTAARNAEGNIQTDAGLTAWQMGDADLPTVIKGYFLCSHTGGHLLMAERFDADQALDDTLSYLGIIGTWIASNDNPGSAPIIT